MEIKSKHAALNLFEMLGIEDITTARQKKNGTTVYELPIKWMNSCGDGYAIRYASYESGYVRNVSPCNSSPWQINKGMRLKRSFGTLIVRSTFLVSSINEYL